MTHLDLFSGIGGFAYAAQQVWGAEYRNVGFCDNNHFCQQILAKNFPGCSIYADIRTLTNTKSSERKRVSPKQERPQAGSTNNNSIDLITGGFPCQPFSMAGLRRGTQDDRHLWPEMLRVIQEFQPSWVIGENVGGLITWNNGVVFEQVCTDLEATDYEVQSFIIPAAAIGAPHRRDRVWIIAHTKDRSDRRLGLEWQSDKEATEYGGQDSDATDSGRQRRQPGNSEGLQSEVKEPGRPYFDISSWERDWQEVAATTCVRRVDDGLPQRLVRLPDGSTITEAKWRREAIKAYGNAIVPQVAIQIMQAIKEQTKVL